MRKALLGVAVASVLLLTGAATGSAQVNCGIIQKDLDRGVTPKDIAELKGISLDEVKKCQEAKKDSAPAAAGEKPAAAPAGAMGGGDMKH